MQHEQSNGTCRSWAQVANANACFCEKACDVMRVCGSHDAVVKHHDCHSTPALMMSAYGTMLIIDMVLKVWHHELR